MATARKHRRDSSPTDRRHDRGHRRYPARRTFAFTAETANGTPLTCTSGFVQCQVGCTIEAFLEPTNQLTGNTGYTIRQGAYDLRKLRGKELIVKPGQTRRYHLTPQNAGTIAALLTLREHVIGPILAGVRSPRRGRKPIAWTSVDRDYEKIRIDMQTLFSDPGIRGAA